MLQKKNTTQTTPSRAVVKLPAAPNLSELDQIFAEAMRQAGTKVRLSWLNEKKTIEFLLNAFFPGTGAEVQWEFFEGADKNGTPLWSYVTSDVLLVSNLIDSSMHIVEKSEKHTRVNEGYGNIYEIPDSHYRTALDLLMQAQQRLSFAGPAGAKDHPVSVLSGDLAQVDISNIMQAISHARMSGCLHLSTPAGEGQIFFNAGLPVHAESGSLIGDECLLTAMLCRHGQFRFEPDVSTNKKTIRQKTEILMLKGVLLRDKAQYLFNAGLDLDSVVKRKRKDLAEAEFETVTASVASGSHLSFSMFAQKQFYCAIDDKSTVGEIISNLRLTESQWIPLTCRMLKADFVELENSEGASAESLKLERKVIDRQAIHAVMMSLRRPETGMYTYPAFLYFLDQEHIRHLRTTKPLSLAIIELRISGAHYEYRSPLPPLVLGECVRRISSVKRDADLLAHYEIFDSAIILPDTSAEGAKTFATRMMNELTKSPLTAEKGAEIFISIGTATLPDDAADLGFLLAAAEAAKNAAQHATNGIVHYSQLATPDPDAKK